MYREGFKELPIGNPLLFEYMPSLWGFFVLVTVLSEGILNLFFEKRSLDLIWKCCKVRNELGTGPIPKFCREAKGPHIINPTHWSCATLFFKVSKIGFSLVFTIWRQYDPIWWGYTRFSIEVANRNTTYKKYDPKSVVPSSQFRAMAPLGQRISLANM